MFANCVHAKRQHGHFCSRLNVKLFFHQIVAQLPYYATGIVRILKTFKIWVFFRKIDGFWKKNDFFFKIDKGGKFAVECVTNGNISLKCLFRPKSEVFLAKKIKKFWKLEKLENIKKVFFEKKSFHLLKSLLYKNGKAQNMPVVAGRLVFSLSLKLGNSYYINVAL